MQSDIRVVLEQVDPAKWVKPLKYRPGLVPTDTSRISTSEPLLLDTTVYIDTLQGKAPTHIGILIATNPLFHSTIAIGEMSLTLGHLQPNHPKTARNAEIIASVLRQIPANQIKGPSDEAWIEASMIAGILARTQNLPRQDRRKIWNDVLLALTAVENDYTLISRNSRDMDLIQQIKPALKLILY